MKRKADEEHADTSNATNVDQHESNNENKKQKLNLEGIVSNNNKNYKTNPEFLAALIHTRVEQLKIPDNKVFTADRTDKVVDVFKGLVKHNFLSVPVLTQIESKYYGFVDVADIMNHIVDTFGEQKLKTSEDFWALVESEEEFQKLEVNTIMKYPYNYKNDFHPVKGGYSLYYAIEALAKEKHLHRLAVIDEERNLMSLVTQSQVVEFLNKNVDLIGTKVDKPVREMSRVFHEVFCIEGKAKAIEGFDLMRKKNVMGIGVLDQEGKIIGTFSVKDIKAISTDGRMFWRLFQTVENFLEKVRKDFNEKHKRPRDGEVCDSSATLRVIIQQLCENKLHRVFIVDEKKKPIGIISLKDVLMEIIS